MRLRPRREGLAARQPPDGTARRAGRRLVLATHPPPARDARPADAPLPRAHAALARRAAARDRDGACAAVPREVRGRRRHPPGRPDASCGGSSAPSSLAGLLNWGHELRADLPHGLGRRADPRRPAQPALRPPAAPLARLLRAQPRGRDHQPADERRRGDRPARHRRRHEPRPEHAHARRHRDHPLHPRLAARARDAARDPVHEHRDGHLPQALGPRLLARSASDSAS